MKEHLAFLDTLNINLGAGEMVVVNCILAFVMFGVALGIKFDTFKDIFKNPKSVLLGIGLQWVALPAITCLLAIVLNLVIPNTKPVSEAESHFTLKSDSVDISDVE